MSASVILFFPQGDEQEWLLLLNRSLRICVCAEYIMLVILYRLMYQLVVEALEEYQQLRKSRIELNILTAQVQTNGTATSAPTSIGTSILTANLDFEKKLALLLMTLKKLYTATVVSLINNLYNVVLQDFYPTYHGLAYVPFLLIDLGLSLPQLHAYVLIILALHNVSWAQKRIDKLGLYTAAQDLKNSKKNQTASESRSQGQSTIVQSSINATPEISSSQV
jgi:hypothetical protein